MSQVIVCQDNSVTKGRDNIDGAPVWPWSSEESKSICRDAQHGDYVIHCEFWTKNGENARKKPWAVHRAYAGLKKDGTRGKPSVSIGWGNGISYHKTPEEAVAAARFLKGEEEREAQAKLDAAAKLKADEEAAVVAAAQAVDTFGVEAAAVSALKDACQLLLAYEGVLRSQGQTNHANEVRRSRLAKLEIVRRYDCVEA